MSICLSSLSPEARENLTDAVFALVSDCLEEGDILFDGDDADFEAVADGVWVPCRIFVRNANLA